MDVAVKIKCCFCNSNRLPINGAYHLRCMSIYDANQKQVFYKEMKELILSHVKRNNEFREKELK